MTQAANRKFDPVQARVSTPKVGGSERGPLAPIGLARCVPGGRLLVEHP